MSHRPLARPSSERSVPPRFPPRVATPLSRRERPRERLRRSSDGPGAGKALRLVGVGATHVRVRVRLTPKFFEAPRDIVTSSGRMDCFPERVHEPGEMARRLLEFVPSRRRIAVFRGID